MTNAAPLTLTVRLDAEEAALVAAHVDRLAQKSRVRPSNAYAIRSLLRLGAAEVARAR